MKTLACIKRVPDTGASITLTDDQQSIDTSNLGFRIAPHEESAIEEAVRLAEDHDGTATVVSLGSEDAVEQLRTGLAMNADRAQLLSAEGEWRSRDTAHAIAEMASDDSGTPEHDLLLFGNESADLGSYQVGVRVAEQLDIPFVAGATSLEVDEDAVIVRREVTTGEELYELNLPAAISVREAINEPRYPSMRDRMRARNQEVSTDEPAKSENHGQITKIRLEAPETDETAARILGEGRAAVPSVMEVLEDEVEVV